MSGPDARTPRGQDTSTRNDGCSIAQDVTRIVADPDVIAGLGKALAIEKLDSMTLDELDAHRLGTLEMAQDAFGLLSSCSHIHISTDAVALQQVADALADRLHQLTPRLEPGPPGLYSFTTPSRNIACYVDSGDPTSTGEARCDITEADWQPTPRPATCSYDWGTALSVTPDRDDFGCVSDSANNENVVPYGSRQTRGDFSCDVEQSGVTCTDMATGHGFAISKRAYHFF